MEQNIKDIELNSNKMKEMKELKEELIKLKLDLENIISSL